MYKAVGVALIGLILAGATVSSAISVDPIVINESQPDTPGIVADPIVSCGPNCSASVQHETIRPIETWTIGILYSGPLAALPFADYGGARDFSVFVNEPGTQIISDIIFVNDGGFGFVQFRVCSDNEPSTGFQRFEECTPRVDPSPAGDESATPSPIGSIITDDRLTSIEVRFASDVEPTTVPEPGTSLLLASGCVGLLGYAWRRRRSLDRQG